MLRTWISLARSRRYFSTWTATQQAPQRLLIYGDSSTMCSPNGSVTLVGERRPTRRRGVLIPHICGAGRCMPLRNVASDQLQTTSRCSPTVSIGVASAPGRTPSAPADQYYGGTPAE